MGMVVNYTLLSRLVYIFYKKSLNKQNCTEHNRIYSKKGLVILR